MEFTNPHFSAAPAEEDTLSLPETFEADTAIKAGDKVAPRLRRVTNSPAREYASRDGIVDPLPDNVAALICSFKGRAKVQRNGVKVEREELSHEPIFYWHEESRVCTDLYGKHVIYVLNPNTLDCIHIMSDAGEYIETLPRKGTPDILDNEASKKEIAKHRRYLTRAEERLQTLHEKDSAEILERHRENTEDIKRATTVLPATAETQSPPPRETAPQPLTADHIAQRGDHIQTGINNRRNQTASAASLGHAARNEEPTTDHRSPLTDHSTDEVVEDFTEPTNNHRQNTPNETEIETW